MAVEIPEKRNLRVARSERQRLDRAIATAVISPILFDQNKSVIKPVDVAKLNSLATLMKQKNPSDPAIPLLISGLASAEGGSALNQTLSEDRANAVRDVLQAAGVPHPLIPSGGGEVGAPDDANNRRVNLAADSNFESTYTGNRFSPAAHEFGHAIGLPDEYKNNTTGNLGAKQTSFVALAGAAGVLAPPRWGDRTSSVMSVGVDVLPRHYLTLWEALGSMTKPDIIQSEWSIQ